jgi:hypothetical protein
MNAINDNNDPFEDIFRDRFADFESEPGEILWNKIEPQLPVKPTRRFPYWQISALLLGLFLGGFYFNNTRLPTFSDSSNGRLPSKGSLPYSPPAVVSEHWDAQSDNINKQKGVFVDNTETYSRTTAEESNNGRLPFKGSLPYSPNESSKNKISKNSIRENEPLVASNNISKNQLNPSQSVQSNSIIVNNSIDEPYNKNFNDFTNSGNIFESKDVVYNGSQIVNERKQELSIIDSKSYNLLTNHFKAVKLKLVTVPKEEVYFKEKKPLEFYASAMPLLNYYTITPNGNDANFVHNISVNDDGNRIGFYTQAGLVFTLSDRLKLRTGLTFTKTNHSISYRVRTDSLIVQSPDNQGVDVSFADLNKTYSQTANYLGTKIELQYVFLRGEALTHYVSVGGEGAYRINGNNEVNGFANFAYGVTRQIGDNAYLFIEPTFSYSLNHQSDNSSLLLVKPNKIGFNIGVNFKIK